MNHRFYENEYPEVDDLVMVTFREINDHCVKVTLPEYNDIEGMILLSQLSKRKYIKRISKIARIGTMGVALVTERKGPHIDLSIKYLTDKEKVETREKFKKIKRLDNFIKSVSMTANVPVSYLYENIFWQMDSDDIHEQLAEAYYDFDEVFGDFEIDDKVKEAMQKQISIKYLPKPMRFTQTFQLRHPIGGVEKIKDTLLKLTEQVDPELKIEVVHNCAPEYALTIGALRDQREEKMKEVFDTLQKIVEENDGYLNIN